VSNKIEHLDVEFYRNYIGIEKLLVVDYESGYTTDMYFQPKTYEFEYVFDDDIHLLPARKVGYSDCKPHLKKPSDLTDDEWLYVIYGDDIPDGVRVDENRILWIPTPEDSLWEVVSCNLMKLGKFSISQFNRLYSLHSHPQAEELIKNGLAIDAKESGVYDG